MRATHQVFSDRNFWGLFNTCCLSEGPKRAGRIGRQEPYERLWKDQREVLQPGRVIQAGCWLAGEQLSRKAAGSKLNMSQQHNLAAKEDSSSLGWGRRSAAWGAHWGQWWSALTQVVVEHVYMTVPSFLCRLYGHTGQDRHCLSRVNSAEGCQAGWGAGTHALRRETESSSVSRLVQPGERKVQRGPNRSLPAPENLHSGAWWEEERQWAEWLWLARRKMFIYLCLFIYVLSEM